MLEAITKILEDEKNDEEDISNFDTVALMGMGEPLHNYNEIKEFYHQAMDVLSVRHISLSTSGITDNIIKLAEDDTNYNLCFSLHSPFNDERSELMPINKRYPLEDVIKACEYYYYKKQKDALGLKIKASYLLLKDFNDSDRHIEELIKILNKDVFKVQILLYNENEKLPFKRPSIERAKYFEKKLNEHGLETKISISKGQDIAGACGQMAGKINLSKQKINKKENNPQIACGLFLWATGYFVDTVGKNEKIIKEYIRNQLQEDYIADQIEIKEYIDPFKKENK